jgi:hypothetical protein
MIGINPVRFMSPHSRDLIVSAMRRVFVLLIWVIAPLQSALSDNSVVIGRGFSNEEVASLGSVDDWNVFFLWTLDVNRTVAGPKVKGRVRALGIAHSGATSKYVRSVELFVLSPITEGSKEMLRTGAKYLIVALSPLYKDAMYCTRMDPLDIGIPIERAQIKVDENGSFCFERALLIHLLR